MSREICTPLKTSPYGNQYFESLRPPLISECVPGVSPLSEAIGLQRPFDNRMVLQGIASLLSGDKDDFAAYLRYWQVTAFNISKLRLAFFKASATAAYGPKSYYLKDDQHNAAFQSDFELVPIDNLDDGSGDSGDVSDSDDLLLDDEDLHGAN